MPRLWLRSLLELLAPDRCAGCDLLLAEAPPLEGHDSGFCAACGPLLEPVEACFRPPAADASCFWYSGPLADAIRRFKYDRRDDLLATLRRLVAPAGDAYAGLIDVVVPVPLSRLRLRERGFNQAAVLAHSVAIRAGVPTGGRRLRRVRPTRAQASLPLAERAKNVRGAFRGDAVEGKRVLLVDDVRTSGATCAAAASALREAGAASVLSLTLARRAAGEETAPRRGGTVSVGDTPTNNADEVGSP